MAEICHHSCIIYLFFILVHMYTISLKSDLYLRYRDSVNSQIDWYNTCTYHMGLWKHNTNI